MIVPSLSAVSAAWVTSGTTPPLLAVGGLIPKEYPAYARVLHGVKSGTWRSVAEDAGVPLKSTTQWEEIKITRAGEVNLDSPRKGTLESRESEVLSKHLAHHTRTPENCWFGVWEGWGDIYPPSGATSFRWFMRDLYLLNGAVLDSPFVSTRGATVWWPEDQSWFVATEVDYDSTIVGGSVSAIEELLSSNLSAIKIEAFDSLVLNAP